MGDVPLSPERFPFSPPFVRTPYELHVSSEHHTGRLPQFLDCRLDAKSLGRFWAYFREIPQTGESAIASARRQVELVPVPLDDTGQPGDYDYKIDANRALEAFTGRWVPVPFLRLSNEQWKDGAFKCEKGPSNWARLHVSREDSDGAYRLTFLFDTTIEEREQPTGQYFALCDDDVAENARFALSPKSRDNAWFLNTLWVDEWIAEIYDAHQTARHNGRTTWRENTPFIMEHLATYLTLLEALAASGTVPTVRVVDPAHLTPVDVDLVLDLGNSRSTGMLVETLPQRQTNLNDSYLLQIRDLSPAGSHLYRPLRHAHRVRGSHLRQSAPERPLGPQHPGLCLALGGARRPRSRPARPAFRGCGRQYRHVQPQTLPVG